MILQRMTPLRSRDEVTTTPYVCDGAPTKQAVSVPYTLPLSIPYNTRQSTNAYISSD